MHKKTTLLATLLAGVVLLLTGSVNAQAGTVSPDALSVISSLGTTGMLLWMLANERAGRERERGELLALVKWSLDRERAHPEKDWGAGG